MIDLRSDTVTRPTDAMREAMAHAAVGDDQYGEDPTVSRLEELAAQMLGKEAAVFVASGTMGNLAALLAHCGRGDAYIVGQYQHTYRWAGGGAAVFGSVQPQPLENQPDGTLLLSDIEAAIKPDDIHYARTRLLALENTPVRLAADVVAPRVRRPVRDEMGTILYVMDELQPLAAPAGEY